MSEFETKLGIFFHISPGDPCMNYRLHFQLTLDDKENDFSVILLKLQKNPNYHFADRYLMRQGYALGSLACVQLSMKNYKQRKDLYEILESLAVNGFKYLGSRFLFFVSKDCDKLYFLRSESNDGIIEIYKLRELIADFKLMKNVSLSSLRIGLIVSGTCEGLSFREAKSNLGSGASKDRSQVKCLQTQDDITKIEIHLVDDLLGLSFQGRDSIDCLTDGAGFISLDIANKFPVSVTQGQLAASTENESNCPAAYQCRVFCSMGIFKGCLIPHPSLPSRTILLRNSMQKAPRGSDNTHWEDNFRISTRGHDNAFVEIVNTARFPHRIVSTINNHLIFLLHSNGVPLCIFERMLRYCIFYHVFQYPVIKFAV